MRILLGVCGSVSCYKAFDLCRELTKRSHEVKVVITKGAENFIKPELFKYLGATEVFSSNDDFNLGKYNQSNVLHIDLGNWAEKIIIAPTSANSLSDFAHGKASDLLQSILLAAWKKPTIFFPAMNEKMLLNPITQENIKILNQNSNYSVLGTRSGELICKEEGSGKLLEIEEILELIETFNPKMTIKKNILISTGATKSKLDSVRYLSNPSSGKSGFYIAKAFLESGYKVTVMAGKESTSKLSLLENHPHYELITLETNTDFASFIENNFSKYDAYISSAAFTDIKFKEIDTKLKKSGLNNSIEIEPDLDVLELALKIKSHQKIIGFAAETFNENSQTHLRNLVKEKLDRKPVDLLVVNPVHQGNTANQQIGFKSLSNNYFIYSQQDSEFIHQGTLHKEELGKKLVGYMNESLFQ